MASRLDELQAETAVELVAYPHWRPGQAAFNTVFLREPEIADAIRGTSADPFYNDDNLDAFWTEVMMLLAGEP